MSELFGYSMLQMTIKSICLTLEAGVGHRTMPMLLAKSSFHGDVKNWSTLINLHSELTLEVTDAETFTVKYRWIMFDFCFCFLCFWYCLVYLLIMMMMIPMIFQNIPACNGQTLCVLPLGTLLQWDDGSVGTTAGAFRRWYKRWFQSVDTWTEGTRVVYINTCTHIQYTQFTHRCT